MRRPITAAAAVLLTAGLVGSAFAGGRQAARVLIDCDMSGSTMTVSLAAKTKGGGRPQNISTAGPVIVVIDQKVDGSFRRVSGLGDRYEQTTLPVQSNYQLCSSAGSMIDPSATAIRGRGSVYVSGVGFVIAQCSPSKPPACS